ncbi:MAG: histidine--tRNA ligase [Proteobacteria bacterium]|nr:histidine--tRNA ligase [Pseudomonadota bacterium]
MSEKHKKIEPRVLKGFRDYLPQIAILRAEMIAKLQTAFTSFGFTPIDTPALEYSEILLGKGSDETDKQMFRFTDQGGRDVSLRFDLTVPLARFVAEHFNDITFPFKRYHIAPVWRAEKPQKGRYREFFQCDFDIIGSKSINADAEVLTIANRALDALDINHCFRLNNRQILNGLLQAIGKDSSSAIVLRTIDKLDKLGEETVKKELAEEAKLSSSEIEKVFVFLEISQSKLKNKDLIKELQNYFKDNELSLKGIAEISKILSLLEAQDIADEKCEIDLSIARGLSYYTGTVFETKFIDFPQIGSICSGGRYNDLAGLYTNKELPGVGGSVGLDRIIGAYEELGKIPQKSSTAKVFISLLDEGSEEYCLKIANSLRRSGIACEMSLETGKLGNQIKYASKKGIEYLIIAGSNEMAGNICSVKNLSSGEQLDNIKIGDIKAHLK